MLTRFLLSVQYIVNTIQRIYMQTVEQSLAAIVMAAFLLVAMLAEVDFSFRGIKSLTPPDNVAKATEGKIEV